jgi:protein involved in polysaccharide export with SLBB domain
MDVRRELKEVSEAVRNSAIPRELDKVLLPEYVIESPDILLVEAVESLPDQPIEGEHLVRPDGTIGLGIYGSVRVAGLTITDSKKAIEEHLASHIINPEVSVDVLAYNSKVYYVITDRGGFGEQVIRLPATGNETVLDAISHIEGLPAVASKKTIWIARPAPAGTCCDQILPVDWLSLTQRGSAETNYQILPNDRVYILADQWFTFDAFVAKVTAPFERIMGFTLLGNSTVRVLQQGRSGFGGRGGMGSSF